MVQRDLDIGSEVYWSVRLSVTNRRHVKTNDHHKVTRFTPRDSQGL